MPNVNRPQAVLADRDERLVLPGELGATPDSPAKRLGKLRMNFSHRRRYVASAEFAPTRWRRRSAEDWRTPVSRTWVGLSAQSLIGRRMVERTRVRCRVCRTAAPITVLWAVGDTCPRCSGPLYTARQRPPARIIAAHGAAAVLEGQAFADVPLKQRRDRVVGIENEAGRGQRPLREPIIEPHRRGERAR